ncbi:MAG: PIN domain-containing protein [Caulobacteraceae bacterium]
MSYLVETAVLVEALRPSRDIWVGRWLADHADEELYVTAMSLAALEGGAAALASGTQRNLVTDWVRSVAARFDGRVLGFAPVCAAPCAKLQARGMAAGTPVPLLAAMTCAIADANGLVLAGRAAPHLAVWGGPAVDPWQPMPLAPPHAVAAAAEAAGLAAQHDVQSEAAARGSAQS